MREPVSRLQQAILIAVTLSVMTAVPWPAYGTRILVTTSFAGDKIERATACFYPVPEQTGSVIASLPCVPERRCVPVNTVLNLPAGTWLMIIESEDKLTSPGVARIHSSTDSETASVVHLHEELIPAGHVSIPAPLADVAPNRCLGIYVAPERGLVGVEGSVRPVPAKSSTVIVPAHIPLTPLLFAGGRLSGVGDEITVKAGETRPVENVRNDGVLVVPFRQEQSSLRPDAETLVFRPPDTAPIARVRVAPDAKQGLLFVRNVVPGTYRISAKRGNAPAARNLTTVVAPGAVAISGELLLSSPDSRTVLRWRIDGALFANRSNSTCDERASEVSAPASATLRILSCPDDISALNRRSRSACRVLAERQLPRKDHGEENWDLVFDRGNWAELTYGVSSEFVRLPPRGRGGITEDLELNPISVSGRVTAAGQPIKALVGCVGGTLTLSDDVDGSYRCWFNSRDRERLVLSVDPCDGSGEFSQQVGPNQTIVDIEIPRNRLRIEVTEQQSGKGIAGATVSLEFGSPATVAALMRRDMVTNRDGYAEASRIPSRELRVCAVTSAHTRQCEDVRLGSSEEKTVRLTLVRRAFEGTIHTGSPLGVGAALFVTSPEGVEWARATVSREGRFSLPAEPPPDAAFVLVSSSHPLLLLRRRNASEFEVPAVQPRSFHVVSGGSKGLVMLALGQVIIPVNAFGEQQMNYSQVPYLQPRGVVTVAPVDATLGIRVFLVLPQGGQTPFPNRDLLQSMPSHVLGPAEQEVFFP